MDGPAPAAKLVKSVFCVGVGNLDLRLLGLSMPKNYGDRGYDGGTEAWMDMFGEYIHLLKAKDWLERQVLKALLKVLEDSIKEKVEAGF